MCLSEQKNQNARAGLSITISGSFCAAPPILARANVAKAKLT